jgi:hypothetical protein
MKKRSPLEHLEALTIVVPGGLGLFIVARTLRAYWGHDRVASAIVLAMGVALLFGLLELILRLRRASLLQHEIANLPLTPKDATVDASSPLLAGMLRARLEQMPMPSLGESVAPFLTGLLVMLGLLGTLLGLFETVRGASMALTSSDDVDALRRSLTTPIEGLTRSFGCSAAGISASAMLGLAVALVRRREGRMLRALQSYASGPLRVLSPLRKQARALEQLAGQGAALPEASNALEQVGAQLGALSTRLVTLQETALGSQKEALTELLGSLRGELGKVAAEAGFALHERVAPLVEAAVTRTGEVALRQSEALTESARAMSEAIASSARSMSDELSHSARGLTAELAASAQALRVELTADAELRRRELAAEAEARRAEVGSWVDTLGARIEHAERERAAAHQAELAALTELASRATHEAAARERTLEARWTELVQQTEARELERAAREQAQLSRLAAEEEARLTRLDTLAERVGGDLARVAGAVEEQRDARVASERAHDERARAASEQLRASAEAVARGVAQQERALEQLVERLPPLFSEVAAASQQGAAESLARLVQATDGHLERVSALLGDELTRRMASERAHDERALAALERLEQSSALLDDSVKRQGEALSSLIGRVGELLDSSVERQGSGLEALVERVSGLLAQIGESTQQKAEATLARLAEHADAQAARFAKLEGALESGRAEHASSLAQQLTSHAEQLEQRLSGAGSVVQEAAAIWQATSIEMQAVAELFAKSVERQREASDAWLESLGEVEGAVERAGRHAARDALSDQLASTQEVFARQLQFQRELFEQLRTLRGPSAARGSHGEHDVSV